VAEIRQPVAEIRQDREPYLDSALDFIKRYGDSFGLFDVFLNRSLQSTALNEFSKKFSVRNHSHMYVNGGATTRPGLYANWSHYPSEVLNTSNKYLLEYNNRFRFATFFSSNTK
jgi:hypothetical protein